MTSDPLTAEDSSSQHAPICFDNYMRFKEFEGHVYSGLEIPRRDVMLVLEKAGGVVGHRQTGNVG